MTDAEVLDAIPQEGAERAAGLFAFQTRQPAGPILASARALLEYACWLSEQSAEMRFEILVATERAVKKLQDAKARHRREASK